MIEERDEVPVHDVHRAVALLTEGVEVGLAARTWSLSPAEVRATLGEVCRLENQLTALKYALVRASLAQDGGDAPGRETQQWLQARCRQGAGRARGDVDNAALVDPETGTLAELGQALAAGQVSREHVDVARRAIAQLPTHVVRSRRREVAENLTSNARRFTPADAKKLGDHLLAVLVPQRGDRLDPHAHERRAGWCSWDATGMLRVSGLLAGEAAAAFKTVFDHLAAPGKGPDPDDAAVPLPGTADTRAPAQRGADALELMGRLAGAHPDAGTRAFEPAHVMVSATVDQLAFVPAAADTGAVPPGAATCAGIGPISPALLQRLACDAVLQTVILDSAGRVVEMRTPQRLATRAQRRALAVRDGGCAFPGCSLPPSWCDAHHIVYWTRGGRTVLENLVLLCPRHHSEIHTEEWAITVIDDLPWFIPPPWIDPQRQPLRNTAHAAAADTTRLAQQLWLDVGPPYE